MITIEFQVDEQELADSLSAAPELAPAAAIEQTYFVMPVCFRVDEQDLLAVPGRFEAWRPQPIIGFASNLLHVARAASNSGERSFIHIPDGGVLEFVGTDHGVVISSKEGSTDSAIVPPSELALASRAFCDRVYDFLLERAPVMQSHPFWKNWFNGS